MRIATVVLALSLLPGLVYAQDKSARPKPPAESDPVLVSGACGVFVKWVGLSIGNTESSLLLINGQDLAKADLKWAANEFWYGPYATPDDAKAAIELAAVNGKWGSLHIDGFHNTAFQAEFFPPSRILRLRWEIDCLHP